MSDARCGRSSPLDAPRTVNYLHEEARVWLAPDLFDRPMPDSPVVTIVACHRDPPATPSKLFLNERVEHCGPLAFEVSVLLETLPKQSFDSQQRLGPG